MASLGINSRTKRQATSSNLGQGRIGVYHRGLNTLTKLSNNNSNIVSSSYSLGSGSRGSGAFPGARSNVPRNVPRPLQTSSLKKENGGQDVTAVLVNRANGPGKKVGWGSALPLKPNPLPSGTVSASLGTTRGGKKVEVEPTPAETVERESTQNIQTESQQNSDDRITPSDQPTAGDRNTPWAMNPPSNNSSAIQSNSMRYLHDNNHYSTYSSNRPSERVMNESFCDDQDHDGYRYKNYRHDFNDRNFPHRYSASNHNHVHNNYNHTNHRSHFPETNNRKQQNDSPRDREIRPFARPPNGSGQTHFSYTRYDNDLRRDRDYRAGNDYRESRGHHFRDRIESSRNLEPRGYHYERYESRRWLDRDDRGYFANANEYDRNYYRRPMTASRNEPGMHIERGRSFERKMSDSEDPNFSASLSHNESGHTFHSSSQTVSRFNKMINENSREESAMSNTSMHDLRRQLPGKSETDIILQTIRQREAAEARARAQKEMQTTGDNDHDIHNEAEVEEKKSDTNDRNCLEKGGQEKTILRRGSHQFSGEASGHNVKVEQSRNQHSLQKNESSEKVTNDEYISSVKSGDIESTPSEHESIENIEKKDDMEKMVKNSEEATQHIDSDKNTKIEEIKNISIQSSKDIETNKHLSKPQKILMRKTSALEQQQNVLRQVAAARETSKNDKKIASNKVMEPGSDLSRDKVNVSLKESKQFTNNEVIDYEKLKNEKEAAAKKARAEYTKNRGPRTKGVLFRRLEDGTLIYADLSEEEILKREERKKAKIKKIQEKMEKRELKRIQAKARKEKLKDSKLSSKAQDLTSTSPKEKKNERPSTTHAKAKTYTPAPPPSVSAWKAGPPPGFKSASKSLQTSDDIVQNIDKTDLDQSLFPDSMEQFNANEIDEKISINSFSGFPKKNISWSAQPLTSSDTTIKNDHLSNFGSSTPLTMSVTDGIVKWGVFGGATTNGTGSLGIQFGSSPDWIFSQKDNLWEHKSVLSTTEQTFDSLNKGLSSELENNVSHDQRIIQNEVSSKISLNNLVNGTENLKDNEDNTQLKDDKKKEPGKRTYKSRHPRNKTALNKKKKKPASKQNKNFTPSLETPPASESNQTEESLSETPKQVSTTAQHSKSDGSVRRKRYTKGNAKFTKNRKNTSNTTPTNSNPNTDKSSNLSRKKNTRSKPKRSTQRKKAIQVQQDTIPQAESSTSASK